MTIDEGNRSVQVDGLPVAERFARAFASTSGRETSRRIRRQVFGEDFPEEVDPTSFVTLTDLRRIALELRVAAGHTVVDVGCGRGGPGLWVARETMASLIGIDPVPTAIDVATQRIAAFGLGGRARFQLGEFASTGLPDAALDGAMSVDVLGFVPDKAAAMREVARILRPGAWFVFTAWDYQDGTPVGITAPQVADHRPLLETAGFTVAVYEPTPNGLQFEHAIYEAVLAAEDEIISELGELAGRPVINEARNRLPIVDQRRRILVAARTGHTRSAS